MTEKLEIGVRPIDERGKRLLWALLATLCFSLLANGYSYFNYYPIHDAVDFAIGGPGGGWQIQLGRFLVPLYMRLKTPIAMPWLTGLLSIFYLGLSVHLTAELLGQTSPLGISLIGGFLSANLFTLEANSAQQYFCDVFLFAMLFACLGVYCAWRGRGWRGIAASAACLFASFGMYQAFITFAACLCMLAFLRALALEGSTKAAWRRALTCVAVMAVAGLVYLIVSRLVLRAKGLPPSDVNWSLYTVRDHSLAELWKAVRTNYKLFFRVLFDGRGYVGGLFGAATCLLAALAAARLVPALWKRRAALPLAVLIFAAFPLVSRLVNVFTGMNGAFRTMAAQFLLWPALASAILWRLPEKGRRRTAAIAATALLSLTIIVGNVRFNNGAFTVQRVLNERAVYHTGRVLEDLERYDGGKKLAVLGRFRLESPDEGLLKKYGKINGFMYSTGIDTPLIFVRYANLLGYKLNWEAAYADAVRDLPEVRAMPGYPDEGYILELDDTIVVKLGKAKKAS